MFFRATVILASCVLVAIAAPANGQAYTPRPGTAERAAILDALRPSIEAQLGPNVEFVIKDLKVYDGWAFVLADPQRKGGGAIDGKRNFPDWYEIGGRETTAVLRVQNGRWNLIASEIGTTDVWYCHLGPQPIHPYCPAADRPTG
ncbi:MAG: hypothetical protein ACTHN4_06635 [Sphingomicrobium sp.]